MRYESRVNAGSLVLHSALKEARCEDEGESSSVSLSRPYVRQPQAIRQGTSALKRTAHCNFYAHMRHFHREVEHCKNYYPLLFQCSMFSVGFL